MLFAGLVTVLIPVQGKQLSLIDFLKCFYCFVHCLNTFMSHNFGARVAHVTRTIEEGFVVLEQFYRNPLIVSK